MAERQPTTREVLTDHAQRLTKAEQDILDMRHDMGEVRDAVQELKQNTAKMVEMAEKFIPFLRNILYFLALVGANALLGGDTNALEKLFTLAQKLGGM